MKKLLFLFAFLLTLAVPKSQAQLVIRYNQIVNNTPMNLAITEPSGDTWSGSTVLTLSGGTGASITSQTFVPADGVFNRLDTMYINVNPGSANGTLTICDTATSHCINVTVRNPITWYVRQDGGTRYDPVTNTSGQCDGQGDAAYPGSGTNQHCGFIDIRNLWSDGNRCVDDLVSSMCWFPYGAGGDNFIVRGAHSDATSFPIGQNGPNSGDWFGLAGDPQAAGMPSPNAGSTAHHTTIFGENAGSCSATASKTFINGSYGVFAALSFSNTKYVDMACFDLTQHSSCTQGVNGLSQCNTNFPLDNYMTVGISFGNTASNVTLTDINEHGAATVGVFGPTGDGVTMTRINMVGNGGAGWNADNGAGNQNALGVGSTLVQNYVIAWNGCKEDYPIISGSPIYEDCTDDNVGGYGDGFGTATVANTSGGWHIHFDQGQVYYNMQDGLDALHLTGDGSSMTITRTLAYGNMGQQIKVGGSNGIAINDILYTNCNAARYPGLPNTPAAIQIISWSKNGTVASFVTAPQTLTSGTNVTLNGFVAGASFNLTTQNVVSATGLSSTTFQIPWNDGITASGTESAAVYTTWNGRISDICRAFSGNVLEDGPSSPIIWQYNTVISANTIGQEIDGTGDSAWSINYSNNAFLGFVNGIATGYPSGGTANFPNPIFDTTSPPIFVQSGSVMSNNDTFHYVTTSYTCPNTGLNELHGLCLDPLLTDETWHSFGVPTSFAPLSGSPLISAATPISGVTVDFNGSPRDPTHPTIGAIEGTGLPTVDTPTITPTPGSYGSAQTITISDATGGATICVTTDGTTPTATSGTCTNGSPYTGPFVISVTTTVQALGTLSGSSNSAVLVAPYTIVVVSNVGPITRGTVIKKGNVIVF